MLCKLLLHFILLYCVLRYYFVYNSYNKQIEAIYFTPTLTFRASIYLCFNPTGTMEVDGASEMSRCGNVPPSTNDPDSSACALSPVSRDTRCRRSSPLLSVLLASVGDNRLDDVNNAQIILEDHLLRVWDETNAAAVQHAVTSSCRCRLLRDEDVETTQSRRECSRGGHNNSANNVN